MDKKLFDRLNKAFETVKFDVDSVITMSIDYMNNLISMDKIDEYAIDISIDNGIIKCFIDYTDKDGRTLKFTSYISKGEKK